MSVKSKLSEGDRKVFDATFRLIPDPRLAYKLGSAKGYLCLQWKTFRP